MPAPEISAITLYTSRGKSKYYWVETIADYHAPTRTEIDAGVDLSPIVADHDGWTVQSGQIEAPNLKTRWTNTIPGEKSADDSSLTCYMSEDGDDARDLMEQDTAGFVLRFPGGDVAGNRYDVFPVIVSAQSKNLSVDGSDPDTMEFQFAITEEPAENLTVPAHAGP
ncbi:MULTISPECIES: phage tail tube protein [Pseudonocardia]|uniref:Phage major tail protein 2 n=2 Tax=Pseudonocardia TaxID=1847 RepID=A0A1Y2N665_PSEAH|nr:MULTISPECIES: hypothetical protein [Pseudonocardia]OSY42952.1 hypothetical protein BG845_01194 [Pseudonocardia autotrophica]TDN77528.1 hypothetical protein C8E95_6776 [Pseudonocardia autotrophica]BBG01556.1 hypothetical protein Pdca_27650 [Pseudonocardia autotrophica]GEC29095.1 hypothetical protein PSA01_61240 [Pseudonocardia saturnea]